jgi:hypothetical protein
MFFTALALDLSSAEGPMLDCRGDLKDMRVSRVRWRSVLLAIDLSCVRCCAGFSDGVSLCFHRSRRRAASEKRQGTKLRLRAFRRFYGELALAAWVLGSAGRGALEAWAPSGTGLDRRSARECARNRLYRAPDDAEDRC